jgi:hypothetical protein
MQQCVRLGHQNKVKAHSAYCNKYHRQRPTNYLAHQSLAGRVVHILPDYLVGLWRLLDVNRIVEIPKILAHTLFCHHVLLRILQNYILVHLCVHCYDGDFGLQLIALNLLLEIFLVTRYLVLYLS